MNYKAVDIQDLCPLKRLEVRNMKLRPMDILECRMVGNPYTYEAISAGIDLSVDHFCKVGMNTITDEPEFIFGVAATQDPTVGSPWLLATSDFKITTDWLKRCKREMLPEINKTFPILRNFIHKENKQSKTWLKWLGFKFYDTEVSFHTDGRIAPAQVFIKLGD